MAATVVTEKEFERLVERCRTLPPAEGVYLEDDFVTNIVVTVIDFQMKTPTVVRSMEYFKANARPRLGTLDDIKALLALYPDAEEGNSALAQHLWGYRHWTRAALLRQLVSYFEGEGVTTQEALRKWAESATFKDFEGRVRTIVRGRVSGLGPQVYNWLVMRQGIEGIKADVHVMRFVETTLGRRIRENEAVAALMREAKAMGIKGYELDWRIWEYQRRGA